MYSKVHVLLAALLLVGVVPLTAASTTGEATNGSCLAHAETAEHSAERPLLFLFFSLILGVVTRFFFQKTKLPYTVILLIAGILLGILTLFDSTKNNEFVLSMDDVASMDPHVMMFVFLPILVFESSFSVDVHVFKKNFWQILILASLGVIINAGLAAVLAKFTFFNYEPNWVVSLMVGSILSATDPVAVVALLKELGASKKLGTLIEGESLLNDGTAFVLYTILARFVNAYYGSGEVITVGSVIWDFVRIAGGGPLLGYIIGLFMMLWTSRVFEDPFVEITITIVSAYLTFFIAEKFLHVSGILAVVVLGVYMNYKGKTNLSANVQHFLHEFWGMMSYIANTLIFVIVGVTIVRNTVLDQDWTRYMYLFVVYIALQAMRALSILILYPLLRRTGYGLDWQGAVVLTWGGLRGAVGLILALIVLNDPCIDGRVRQNTLFVVAGIVVLTLIVNGSTTESIMSKMKMNAISPAQRLIESRAIKNIEAEMDRTAETLKNDKFLRGADWDWVQKRISIVRKTKERIESDNRGRCLKKKNDGAGGEAPTARRKSMFRVVKKNSGGAPVEPADEEKGKGQATSTTPMRELRHSDTMRRSFDLDDHSTLMAMTKAGGLALQTVHDLERQILIHHATALKNSYWKLYKQDLLSGDSYQALVEAAERSVDLLSVYGGHKVLEEKIVIPPFILRLLRTPFIGTIARKIMNSVWTFRYELALGHVVASRDALRVMDSEFTENDRKIALRENGRVVILQDLLDRIRSEVTSINEQAMKNVNSIEVAFPEVALAIKSRQAAKYILHSARKTIDRLKKNGNVDEDEGSRLFNLVEESIKRLVFSPMKISRPSPREILKQSLFQDVPDALLDAIVESAKHKIYEAHETILREGEQSKGICVVTAGVVQKTGFDGIEYTGKGTIIGDVSFLSATPSNTTVKTETIVESVWLFASDIRRLIQLSKCSADNRVAELRPGLTFECEGKDFASQIWRKAAIRLGVNLLRKKDPYNRWPLERITFWLNRWIMGEPNDNIRYRLGPVPVIIISGSMTRMRDGTVINAPNMADHLGGGEVKFGPSSRVLVCPVSEAFGPSTSENEVGGAEWKPKPVDVEHALKPVKGQAKKKLERKLSKEHFNTVTTDFREEGANGAGHSREDDHHSERAGHAGHLPFDVTVSRTDHSFVAPHSMSLTPGSSGFRGRHTSHVDEEGEQERRVVRDDIGYGRVRPSRNSDETYAKDASLSMNLGGGGFGLKARRGESREF
uniref:Cyclic nucleotide-binding domain-containing protein n=1 Tax=Palpitomonas bilix TaxID=652834 RepID=A0A7S3GFN4_9EUKA|mmetsp:Transcript_47185/g.121969  ORF Transcript_47185/g.121969 Transcript_47185/m.121969 type:complete len:1246 (+) Transcript_47185:126-3863(+)